MQVFQTLITRSRRAGGLIGLVSAVALLTLVLAAGCSGSSDSLTNPGNQNSGGTGTQTLRVSGEVMGSVSEAGPYKTNFEVSVSDSASVPISGAVVTVQASFGIITLSEDSLVAGTYKGTRTGYAGGRYTMNVTSGSDLVAGVWVNTPTIHTITSPALVDTVTADQPLVVTWSRSLAAQEVWVKTQDFESQTPSPDTGTYTVPASGNPARVAQRVELLRVNRQTASGGLPGSTFKCGFREIKEPIVVQ